MDHPVLVGNPLLSWQAPEHIHIRPNPRGLMIAVVVLALIILYAIITDSPLMAITFSLLGMVGYLLITRDPREFQFSLTDKGVLAGKSFYPFEDMNSFCIHIEPPLEGVLSIYSNGILSPFIHIPIGDASPQEITEILSNFLPEEQHSPNVIDTLERMLHI